MVFSGALRLDLGRGSDREVPEVDSWYSGGFTVVAHCWFSPLTRFLVRGPKIWSGILTGDELMDNQRKLSASIAQLVRATDC